MCGVCGIYNLAPQEETHNETLRKMCEVMGHRGPDDEGYYFDAPISLGHKRLSIIDLSPTGHQPMTSEDGSFVIVYNGELYNFHELGAILKARGHLFRSKSDTEVVLRAYEEWGEACVQRFNGMFAFAIWDRPKRRLFLARDRFGIKPLYYAVDHGRFLFASEIKALLTAGLPRRVCLEAIVEYFTFQNIFTDRTLFQGVHLLPAGHSMTVSENTMVSNQYWDLLFEPDHSLTEDEWAASTRAVFEASVMRQLMSDVPVGSYLSGGIDSASLVAVASRHIPRMMTFTGGFDLSSVTGLELVFDERKDAEVISSTFRTEHYEMVMHAGDMAWAMPKLVWHLEDLRVGMCYQNYYIARLASKFAKVTLTGTGGDEMFAGYPWRYDLISDTHGSDEFDRRYYHYWTRLVPDSEKSNFFSHDVWVAARHHDPFSVYRQMIKPVASLEPVSKALYFEAKTFLHGLLVVEDKVSMAHSLEVRVPFLDNELVDLARRIPSHWKHRNGGGKYILRKAMVGLLPDEIVNKVKQGFSPPDGSWYRSKTMDYVREVLLGSRSINRGYFQPAYIRRIISEHAEGQVNHRLLIWSLLCFEWWNRLFMDDQPLQEDSDAHVSHLLE